MTIIGTVTATNKVTGKRVERSIHPFEVDEDVHIFAIEDRACDETFPEDHFDDFEVWVIRELECDLCYRPIKAAEAPALCPLCDRTARAHARVIKAEKEWREDGSP